LTFLALSLIGGEVSQEKLDPLRQKKEFASTLVNLQTIGVRAINPPCNE
jgi:hypothetical protein